MNIIEELLSGLAQGRLRVLELSHTINASFPAWPGEEGMFEIRPGARREREGFFTRIFRMPEHFATHVDAPAHFAEDGCTVDQIPAERLVCPAVIIDVRDEAERDAGYLLSAERLARWEKEHGRMPPGALAILHTGWWARLPDVARYFNRDAAGTMHFPGFSAAAAKVLIERGANGLGCDTMSIDGGASPDCEVHQLCLRAGLYQIENLTGLSALPESGALVVVAPLKLEGGSGAPCRVLALLPDER